MIGAFINVGRLALVDELDVQTPAAVGLAALAAGLLATFAAERTRFSRVTLSVPAVVIMIPGVPLYRSLTYLNNGQMLEALQSLFTVIFTIVGIGMGLAVARMLTDKNWLTESAPVVPLLDEVLPDSFSPTDSADTVANDHTSAQVHETVGAAGGEEALSEQSLAEARTPDDTSSNQELSE